MYHYRISGLPNVWLVNGIQWHDTAYGKAIGFTDIEGLHLAIAQVLLVKDHLTGAEFRFVRRTLNLSQAGLGKIFARSGQAIALWEKRRGAPIWAQRFLYGLYREHVGRPVKLFDVFFRHVESRANRRKTAAKPARLNFEKPKRGAWRLVEARQRAAA